MRSEITSKMRIFFTLIAILFIISSAGLVRAESIDDIPLWAKSYFEKDSAPMNVESPIAKKNRLQQKINGILNKRVRQDEVQLIIKLNTDFKPEEFLSSTAQSSQRNNISVTQQSFLNKLKAKQPHYADMPVETMKTVPYMVVRVNAEDLQDLIDLDEIADIEVDRLSSPSLAESAPIIQATNAWAQGYTGNGQVVAVLDTGVEKTHPFLAGKVVSEACYSNAGGFGSGISLCPGGVTSSTAVGSGVNCNAAVSGCDHGTHVAGIVAGNNGSLYGVARDAGIIAINVFTNIGGSARSYSSDQIKALERVYALRGTYDIAAVNMSLGGDRYTSNCDSNSLKPIIDNLKAAGIATVIASGNDGFTDAISAPSCISTAVTVGSTMDGSYGTAVDGVSSFSNSSTLIDLLAPGQYITSSVPGGAYAVKMGTSMATPQVAGAFAMIKAANNTATVDEIEGALKTTGTAVMDSKNGVTKPRINVNDAITSFGTGDVVVNISPAGAVSDGAQWAIDGGNWNNSGATVSGVRLGSHTVTFKSATHSNNAKIWITPSSQTTTISSDGETKTISVSYTEADKPANSKNDADGDGKSDVVWRNLGDGSLYFWGMDGASVSSQGYLQAGGTTKYVPLSSWGVKGFSDVNGDGKSDLLWRNLYDGSSYIWMMDGAAITSEGYIQNGGSTVYVPDSVWRFEGFADMSGDGKSDILWRNIGDGSLYLWMMDGTNIASEGYIKNGGSTIYVPVSAWEVSGLDDVNGDGKADIIWRNLQDGSSYVWMMDSLNVSGEGFIQAGGVTKYVPFSSWKIDGIGDANGDSKADILWRNQGDGSLYIWFMDGASITSEGFITKSGTTVYVPVSSWSVKSFADTNGDGKADVLWSNLIDGSLYSWHMDSTAVSSEGYVKSGATTLYVPSTAWRIDSVN